MSDACASSCVYLTSPRSSSDGDDDGTSACEAIGLQGSERQPAAAAAVSVLAHAASEPLALPEDPSLLFMAALRDSGVGTEKPP